MLDIKFIRENAELVKKGVVAKQFDPKVVDQVLELDKTRRELIQKCENLRSQRNEISREQSETGHEKGKQLKTEIKNIEEKLKTVEDEFKNKLYEIPNLPANDVKYGKNDQENEIIKKWGKPRNFDFKIRSHNELGEYLGIIDCERATKVSGPRFGYLKGDGVLLEFALQHLALDILVKEGFIPVIPPVLIKRDMMKKMGYLEHGGEEDMYVLDKDGLILVGTSEQSIGAMHANEILDSKKLPVRYLGFSTCFRREAGSYGKDTKGTLRVHQFNKVEMFSFTKPETSDKEHEYLLSLEEKLLQTLGIPYQVAKMVSGDLGIPAARKYDLEGWFPAEGKYRELTSTSTCTDYQARRLNIRYKEESKIDFVHMLNGTAFSGRPILAILENYQNTDGTITVPQALQLFMGKDKITK